MAAHKLVRDAEGQHITVAAVPRDLLELGVEPDPVAPAGRLAPADRPPRKIAEPQPDSPGQVCAAQQLLPALPTRKEHSRGGDRPQGEQHLADVLASDGEVPTRLFLARRGRRHVSPNRSPAA